MVNIVGFSVEFDIGEDQRLAREALNAVFNLTVFT